MSNIGIDQFMHGLEGLGIPSTIERVAFLFRRFDKTRDGTLSYEELASALLPKNERYAYEL